MGGTWVSHFQGNLFREMQRYGVDRDLVTTRQSMHENNYYTTNISGKIIMRILASETVLITIFSQVIRKS